MCCHPPSCLRAAHAVHFVCASGCTVTPPEPEPRTNLELFPVQLPIFFGNFRENALGPRESSDQYRSREDDEHNYIRAHLHHTKPPYHPSPLRRNKSQLVRTSPLLSAFAPATSARNPPPPSSPSLGSSTKREYQVRAGRSSEAVHACRRVEDVRFWTNGDFFSHCWDLRRLVGPALREKLRSVWLFGSVAACTAVSEKSFRQVSLFADVRATLAYYI